MFECYYNRTRVIVGLQYAASEYRFFKKIEAYQPRRAISASRFFRMQQKQNQNRKKQKGERKSGQKKSIGRRNDQREAAKKSQIRASKGR